MRRRTLFHLSQRLGRAGLGLPRRAHTLDLDIVHVAQWFHAVSDTRRLGILEFLTHRERTVRELQENLDLAQSSVSFHLKVLKQAGLVCERRDGRWRYYGVRSEILHLMSAFLGIEEPGKHADTCSLSCCH